MLPDALQHIDEIVIGVYVVQPVVKNTGLAMGNGRNGTAVVQHASFFSGGASTWLVGVDG